MRKAQRTSKLQSQINVVPYVDVMLVLLVIFMITAPLLAQSIIELPPAGDLSSQQKNDAIEIQLPANGGFRVKDYNFGGEETDFSTLDNALQLVNERRSLFPDAPILISADRKLAYEKVIEVLAVLHEEGVANIGLVTRVGE